MDLTCTKNNTIKLFASIFKNLMHPILKSALRFALGAVILLVGVVIMNGLISLKKELPVSDRRTPARAVRVLPVEIASRVPLIPIEGRVEARYRADILAEVTGTLQLGGKELLPWMTLLKSRRRN